MTESTHDDYEALLDRLKTFGVVVLSVLIDLFFVVIWVVAHQTFDMVMHYLSSPGVGLNAVAAKALEYIFTASTLAVVAIYVIADFVSSVRRIRKKAG